MPYQLPPDRRTERRERIGRWIGFGFAALLVALVAYFGYVGYEGSRQLADAPNPSRDCRTPATLGWTYEAINYDIAADVAVASQADPTECATSGPPAGDALTGADGVPLAGWYVPAGSGAAPTSATVVLAHGWGGNKSTMLDRAAVLHEAYNLVLFDFRNHGQSGEAPTTQGVREAGDLRAVLDWLQATKAPEQVALFGVSMGGASALSVADDDERVDVLVVESTHATLANAAQARLDQAGYPLSLPGSWAILLGSLLRTGEDVSAADPIAAASRLDGQPVLFIHGDLDDSIGPTDAEDLRAAAAEAGSPAELQRCPTAGHGGAPTACPEEYPGWVLGFLERVLPPG
ncbi:MAG TPA: alpha/beta hydrolase [Candidatus Limnocylindria bacterium]|nr:alpha/beta hydrolase [Candidatus Limnocylindria bacterium]